MILSCDNNCFDSFFFRGWLFCFIIILWVVPLVGFCISKGGLAVKGRCNSNNNSFPSVQLQSYSFCFFGCFFALFFL